MLTRNGERNRETWGFTGHGFTVNFGRRLLAVCLALVMTAGFLYTGLIGEAPVLVEAASAPVANTLEPVASGTVVYSNEAAEIDASNTGDGYVMAKILFKTDKKIKVLVTVPDGTRYTYDLSNQARFEVFPLSGGDGEYTVGIYQNISGTTYSTLYSKSISVNLKDEYAPFLVANQYVNYNSTTKFV